MILQLLSKATQVLHERGVEKASFELAWRLSRSAVEQLVKDGILPPDTELPAPEYTYVLVGPGEAVDPRYTVDDYGQVYDENGAPLEIEDTTQYVSIRFIVDGFAIVHKVPLEIFRLSLADDFIREMELNSIADGFSFALRKHTQVGIPDIRPKKMPPAVWR